jgi:hypothetical protein
LKKTLTQCEDYEVDLNYGDSKAINVLVPKVHINAKITLKWKKKLKTNV